MRILRIDTADTTIELIGMPASGKTTFVRSVCENNKDIWFANDVFSKRKVARIITKIRYLVSMCFSSPVRFYRDYVHIRKTGQKTSVDTLSVFVNWQIIKKTQVLGNKTRCAIWDQGILQAIWSICYASEVADSVIICNLLQTIELPKYVICLDATDQTLAQRAKTRGTYLRLDYLDVNMVERGRQIFSTLMDALESRGYESIDATLFTKETNIEL